MALMEKPGPEYGVVLRLSDGRVEPGDKFEGDFSSIDQIRKVKNIATGEIMMRGVRYSSSRTSCRSCLGGARRPRRGRPRFNYASAQPVHRRR